MTKAISLLSGGLDSILATKLVLEQGIEVEAVNFKTVFCTCTSRNSTCLASKSAADKLGIKLKIFEISREYFPIVKNPKHGYGSQLNPCLDCRILIFKKAGEYMKATGASFLITGEVLGERPMSQRRDALRIIERDSGLDGLILRPLSAKLFQPTVAEREGLIDREKLLDIKGRSRKPQIELAKELGINDYPCPAGGCLLTDSGFANRMRDLIEHNPDFTTNDVKMLKVGRHFRLNENAKLIVGRNEQENDVLEKLIQETDCCFYPKNTTGPFTVGRGAFDKDTILAASCIVARYCDNIDSQRIEIIYKKFGDNITDRLIAAPANQEMLDKVRI